MPRSTESQEGKILKWFRTAPLGMAVLLLGLVKGTVQDRQTHGERIVASRKKGARKQTRAVKTYAEAVAPKLTLPTPKAKKSHKKKPAKPAADTATVDSFD